MSEFSERGYAKFKLIDAEKCKSLRLNYQQDKQLHQCWPDMPGIIRTSINDWLPVHPIHEMLAIEISMMVGEPVRPSYTFTSCYERGSCLPAHTDRPECRYNVSLMLDSAPDWPLYIEHAGQVHAVSLEAGEAVLYSGTQDRHWRDVMPPQYESVLGVFFHYIPA